MVFFQRSLAVFLMANTLLGILWQPLVYADFKLRQEYIAKVLCIEKDEPLTVCHGHCVLTARLQEVELPREQDRPQESQSRLLEITFFQSKSSFDIPACGVLPVLVQHSFEYSRAISKGFALDVFNPPKQA